MHTQWNEVHKKRKKHKKETSKLLHPIRMQQGCSQSITQMEQSSSQDWQDTSMQKYTKKKKKIGTGMANGKILFYVFFGVWTT